METKKQKHEWVKEKVYICEIGNADNHEVSSFLRCEKCGATKQIR